MGEQLGKAAMGSEGPTLDRAYWNAQTVGGLLVSETEKERGFDHGPFLRCQPVHRISNFPGLPHPFEGGGKGNDVRFVHPVNPMAPFPAIYVDGHPAGNGVKPWGRVPFEIECVGGTPGLEKCLLSGVLGEHSIAESSQAHAKNRPPVLLIERPDSIGVSGSQPFH